MSTTAGVLTSGGNLYIQQIPGRGLGLRVGEDGEDCCVLFYEQARWCTSGDGHSAGDLAPYWFPVDEDHSPAYRIEETDELIYIPDDPPTCYRGEEGEGTLIPAESCCGCPRCGGLDTPKSLGGAFAGTELWTTWTTIGGHQVTLSGSDLLNDVADICLESDGQCAWQRFIPVSWISSYGGTVVSETLEISVGVNASNHMTVGVQYSAVLTFGGDDDGFRLGLFATTDSSATCEGGDLENESTAYDTTITDGFRPVGGIGAINGTLTLSPNADYCDPPFIGTYAGVIAGTSAQCGVGLLFRIKGDTDLSGPIPDLPGTDGAQPVPLIDTTTDYSSVSACVTPISGPTWANSFINFSSINVDGIDPTVDVGIDNGAGTTRIVWHGKKVRHELCEEDLVAGWPRTIVFAFDDIIDVGLGGSVLPYTGGTLTLTLVNSP